MAYHIHIDHQFKRLFLISKMSFKRTFTNKDKGKDNSRIMKEFSNFRFIQRDFHSTCVYRRPSSREKTTPCQTATQLSPRLTRNLTPPAGAGVSSLQGAALKSMQR